MATKTLKILHAPTNIGGMPLALAEAQRKLGHDARSYSTVPSTFKYPIDIQLDIYNNPEDQKEAFKNIFKFAWDFDVFHFYFGESLTKERLLDIPLLKLLNKKVVFYFCGCDIRDAKKVISQYDISACKECWPMLCSKNRELAYKMATKYADVIFVSTPDLLEFLPGSVLLPQPINLEIFDELIRNIDVDRTPNGDKVIIAHAPTSQTLKGSKYIIKAIQELIDEGYNLEMSLIENRPYHEAISEYAKADIIVDQVLFGWYGQVALEMMALKKPVICYIREDLENHLGEEIPIINANPRNIKDVIKDQLSQKETWKSLGEKGRAFVEKYHDALKVAQQALESYRHA
jgi:glycosyltransferase involved in cell wall biosynthesis